MAFVAIIVATAEVVDVIIHIGSYFTAPTTGDQSGLLRVKLLTGVIEAFDIYLIAAVFFIFSLGLYELFR